MSKKVSYSISEFKAHALRLMEGVHCTGKSIIVTKRGKAIAQVVPIHDNANKPTPGTLAHTVIDERDMVSPLGSKLWKAARG